MLAALLLVAGLGLHVSAQSDRAVCLASRTPTWLQNEDGDGPCVIWAQMAQRCDSRVNFVIALQEGQHYGSPDGDESNACSCNLLAYNLMAGCTYCQGVAETTWLPILGYMADCDNWAFSPPSNTSNISIPVYARMSTSITWDPADAQEYFQDFSGTSSPAGSATAVRPTSGTSSVRPSAASGGDYPTGGWDDDVSNAATAIGIGVGVAVGLPFLASIIALIVFCVRQKNRKPFYASVAEYYRKGGAPPPSAYNSGGPPGAGGFYASTPATVPTSPSVAPVQSMYGTPAGYQQPYDPNGYQQQGYNPNATYGAGVGAYGANHGNGYNPYETSAMAPTPAPAPGTPTPHSPSTTAYSGYPSGVPINAPTAGGPGREVSTVAAPPATYSVYSQQQAYQRHPEV